VEKGFCRLVPAVVAMVFGAANGAAAANCAILDAGRFEQAAIAAAKSSPPPGCKRDWKTSLDKAELCRDSSAASLREDWTVTAVERFVACYKKGDYGIDTDKRYIPASEETPVHVVCTAKIAWADGGNFGTDDPTCAVK